MLDFTLVFGAFIVSVWLSMKVRWWCEERGLVNHVTARSSHRTPTLRGGGLSFVMLGTLAAFAFALSVDIPNREYFLALTITSVAIAVMGWLDDIKSRRAILRLLVQGVCVGICLAFLPALFGAWGVPVWVEKVLLFFAWVWFINLYNFMDGIDGLAGAEAIFLSIVLSFISPFKPVLLVLGGALLGFMRLNWHPAKIFMGDVGSTWLGFFLGGLFIVHASPETVFVLLTLTLVFSADATWTLFKRIVQRKKPWEAHKEHFYQRAVQAGMGHSQVVIGATLLNLGLMVIAFAGLFMHWGMMTLVLGLGLMAFAGWRVRHIEGK